MRTRRGADRDRHVLAQRERAFRRGDGLGRLARRELGLGERRELARGLVRVLRGESASIGPSRIVRASSIRPWYSARSARPAAAAEAPAGPIPASLFQVARASVGLAGAELGEREADVRQHELGIHRQDRLLLARPDLEVAGVHRDQAEVVPLRNVLRVDLDRAPAPLERVGHVALDEIREGEVRDARGVRRVLLDEVRELLDRVVGVAGQEEVAAAGPVLLAIAHPVHAGEGEPCSTSRPPGAGRDCSRRRRCPAYARPRFLSRSTARV